MDKPSKPPEPGPAWKAAEAYGLDMSLIESNLRRTPAERIRVHSLALAAAHVLRNALAGQAQDSDDLISRLVAGGVDLVVVGGLAAFAHGVTSTELVVEVCCDFSAPNLRRLQSALADVSPEHRKDSGHRPLDLQAEGCGELEALYLDTAYGPLDCLAAVAGVGAFEDAKRNSIEIRLSAGAGHLLSLDALIRSKEALDRPRDREAVIQLRAIRERLEQLPPSS